MTIRERAIVEELMRRYSERADLLRATADDLSAGKINRYRAANRIRRIAGEIVKPAGPAVLSPTEPSPNAKSIRAAVRKGK